MTASPGSRPALVDFAGSGKKNGDGRDAFFGRVHQKDLKFKKVESRGLTNEDKCTIMNSRLTEVNC